MGESIVPFRGHIKLELRSDLSPPGFLFRFYNEHPRLFDTRVSRAGNFIQSILKLKGFILVIHIFVPFKSKCIPWSPNKSKPTGKKSPCNTSPSVCQAKSLGIVH